jgi:hypothetical protein
MSCFCFFFAAAASSSMAKARPAFFADREPWPLKATWRTKN